MEIILILLQAKNLTISIQNLFLPIASTLLHMNILASTFLGVKETILLYCDFKIIYVRLNFFEFFLT